MVSKWLKESTGLMFQRQTSILSAAGVLMVMSLGGAVLSLIKLHIFSELVIPNNLVATDAFKAAFKLPDFIFQIVVVGALNAAFIPVYGSLLNKGRQEESENMANGAMLVTLLFFALFAVVVFFLAEPFVKILIAPNFTGEKLQLTADLTRLMMISPMLLGVSAFLTGILQVKRHFIIPALAPIFYNVGSIIGIKLFPMYGVWGLAYGVILGSALHLFIQLPLVYHLGFRFKVKLDLKNSSLRQVGKLMAPRAIGLSVDQLESLVASELLSTLATGSYTLFSQVFSLVTFPISFFGVSIAQASLPTLSKEATDSEDSFRQTLLTTFHQILYLIVPVAVLMVVLRVPITRVVLNFPGASGWANTLLAAQVLLFFAPGLIAQSAIHLWVRGFYAIHDTVSPLMASAIGVIVSVVIALLTLHDYQMRGIALGMTVGGFATLLFLIVRMWERLGGFGWANFYGPTVRILVAGAIMALAVYLPIKPIEALFLESSTTINLILLSALVSWFGLSLYLLVSWILGSDEILMFIRMAHKVRSWRQALMKLPPTYQDGLSGEMSAE